MLQDSLQGVAALVAATLPQEHAITRCLERLAAGNMSAKSLAKRREEEDLIKVGILFTIASSQSLQ